MIWAGMYCVPIGSAKVEGLSKVPVPVDGSLARLQFIEFLCGGANSYADGVASGRIRMRFWHSRYDSSIVWCAG